ncbi:uncharacterized protein LOC125229394 [Leguminivora glycinivorella]|uniref:uncharacterized protein LOC125229394 n=1 Tax=Leguminivora glycinivorella TaxID=1035111 RepID=UPI00200D6226|nr:uncharacterized protein LOC125229394 [Leguminivora glycinivorella]
MLSGRLLFCAILLAAWHEAHTASLPYLRLPRLDAERLEDVADPRLPGDVEMPVEPRARVREGVPPPLCAGRCASPPRGPVCAFDAAGTARTFATLCELEAVSCRESTYYAITSLGEC